ncbi:TRAP transporter substrate-binding protein [Afifella pfennigii]|uniref:TRAP transporter substrate-binding protein n=1 Tax=Afifella pfennigii TaxID=209897 RepID=UPI0006900BF0|nr:TRAP transporter substrate-binding protein [Afifella pfennigii]
MSQNRPAAISLATTRRRFLAGGAALAGSLAMPALARAEPVKLTVSHFVAPTHGLQLDFLIPWLERIKERSGGEADYEIFAVNSAFGRAERQVDQVRAGVVDIGYGIAGIPRGRFPHTSVMELPFMVDKAGAGTRALWELYETGRLGNEYDGLKVLLLMTHHGGLFHTVERPVEELADLKGLRMRSPSPAVSAMLDYLGASPIGMPPVQIYESLQKRALDGLATTWDLVAAVKANEILRYHTEAGAYTAAFHVVMSEERFSALPKAVRDAIEAESGEALLPRVPAWWDKWDAVGRADALQRGHAVIAVSEEKRAAWRAELQPMTEAYLDGLKAEGVADPHALYETARELVAKYAAA